MEYSGYDGYLGIDVWQTKQGPYVWFVQENSSMSFLPSPSPDTVRTFKLQSMELWMDVRGEVIY